MQSLAIIICRQSRIPIAYTVAASVPGASVNSCLNSLLMSARLKGMSGISARISRSMVTCCHCSATATSTSAIPREHLHDAVLKAMRSITSEMLIVATTMPFFRKRKRTVRGPSSEHGSMSTRTSTNFCHQTGITS